MAAGKKPSLGEVAANSGPLDPAEPDADDAYGAAVDEFLELVGVSEDKLDAAREAFRAAVMSCT